MSLFYDLILIQLLLNSNFKNIQCSQLKFFALTWLRNSFQTATLIEDQAEAFSEIDCFFSFKFSNTHINNGIIG
jgi:hypothetical protein